MAESSTVARIGLSTAAGVGGFVVGFYAGFFLLLSIWGLETGGLAFVLVGGGLGVIGSGLGIALTVRTGRKIAALVSTAALGAILLVLIHLIDADFGSLLVGGLVLTVVVSVLVRMGSTDAMTG